MKKIRLTGNKDYIVDRIDERIYGSFVEHMGRVVYSGIYEPGSQYADADGFRADVLEAVKELGITVVRYPGGNFVSAYRWEDGVGPVEKRPKRLDLAWKSLETNEFGTDEFMKWCKKAGTTPMLAVNLGTRGMEDAINYIEYCNIRSGSQYSDMRVQNGITEPYHVKTWCLGNEMDGAWQIGHKSAHEYGRIAAEVSKAMKAVDASIETVLCGSSLNTMDTFPEWEAVVLDDAYPYVDYISLHQYFGGQEKGTEGFLMQADSMTEYIRTVACVCEYIRAKKRTDRRIKISMDEWGVWAYAPEETVKQAEEKRWKKAPAISEMIYTFEDSLLFAGMLMSILKNCDIVKMACQSLLTNVSAMLMTGKDGELWRQTTYYPFSYMSRYGRGTVLDVRTDDTEHMMDQVVVYHAAERELILFIINRSVNDTVEFCGDIQGYELKKVIEHIVFHSDDRKADNQDRHDRVVPKSCEDSMIKNGKLLSRLPALSWNMIRVQT